MTEPLFSVIMAAYNAARTIDAAIESVLGQRHQDFELVVVDDGSTDETAERVEAFRADSRVRLVQQENHGLAAARTAALAHARGSLVSVLDSDDLYLPTYLEAHGAALEEAGPSAGFAYSDAWVLDDRVRRILRKTAAEPANPPIPPPPDAESFLLAMLRRGNFVSALATVRRSVLEEAGPWNARFRSAEDYELWLRVLSHGYRGVRVAGNHLIIRDRPGSLTKAAVSMLESRCAVYRLVIDSYPTISDEAREVARAELRRYEEQLRRQRSRHPAVVALRRARLFAGRVVRHVRRRWRYYDRPPPEVANAYPDLTLV